ncbi:MAG: PcfK-like family protein [Rikenellaceae bacterium]
METTDHFKETIKQYLDQRAARDAEFAERYAKDGKNINDCCTYILNWVQKSGCNGFTDDEIFGQAVHYYDEDNIDIGNPVTCKVVVNHTVELTEEEKAQAKEDVLAKVREEAIQSATPKAKPKAQSKPKDKLEYPSLF